MSIATDKSAWAVSAYRNDVLIGSMSLPSSGLLTIGRSSDHDVVLRDLSATDAVLQLSVDRPQIGITVLSGQITVGENTYSNGAQFMCDDQTILMSEVGLKFSGLALGTSDSLPEALVAQSVAASADITDDREYSDTAAQVGLHEPNEPVAPWFNQGRLVGGSLVACALVFLSIGSWQVLASLSQQQPAPEAVVQAFLVENELAGLDLQSSTSGLVLSGTLKTNEQRMQVERFLREQAFATKQQFVVLEQLQSQLVDVFRINGVAAIVTFDESGVLQAATAVADEQQLDIVRQAVGIDMPQLKNWNINNVAPPVQEAKIPEDPGKRVAMVVSDEPAYVLTQDQTRYFIGSMLPTGHQITNIKEGRVFLTKDDTTSELEF